MIRGRARADGALVLFVVRGPARHEPADARHEVAQSVRVAIAATRGGERATTIRGSPPRASRRRPRRRSTPSALRARAPLPLLHDALRLRGRPEPGDRGVRELLEIVLRVLGQLRVEGGARGGVRDRVRLAPLPERAHALSLRVVRRALELADDDLAEVLEHVLARSVLLNEAVRERVARDPGELGRRQRGGREAHDVLRAFARLINSSPRHPPRVSTATRASRARVARRATRRRACRVDVRVRREFDARVSRPRCEDDERAAMSAGGTRWGRREVRNC